MGWTSYEAPIKVKNGKRYIDRKEECDKLFNLVIKDDNTKEKIGKFEVVKSYIVGTTYYAAIRKTKFATKTEKEFNTVFGMVVLTKTDMRSKCNFYYKAIEENWGPCRYNCPKAILDILSSTDNKNAIEWREKCKEIGRIRNLPTNLHKLPVGTTIKFKAPFDFKLYDKGETVTVWKAKKPYNNGTYWTDGHFAYNARVIGYEYEIVEDDE